MPPVNFNDILMQDTATVERPPLPPLGMYAWAISKVPVLRDQKGKDGTNYKVADFLLKAVRAVEVEDQDALAAFGDVKKITVRKSFMINLDDETAGQGGLFRLTSFLNDHLKIETGPLKVVLNNSLNKTCLGELTYRADTNNPEINYPDIGKTAPLE